MKIADEALHERLSGLLALVRDGDAERLVLLPYASGSAVRFPDLERVGHSPRLSEIAVFPGDAGEMVDSVVAGMASCSRLSFEDASGVLHALSWWSPAEEDELVVYWAESADAASWKPIFAAGGDDFILREDS